MNMLSVGPPFCPGIALKTSRSLIKYLFRVVVDAFTNVFEIYVERVDVLKEGIGAFSFIIGDKTDDFLEITDTAIRSYTIRRNWSRRGKWVRSDKTGVDGEVLS